jgi:dolichol-phosphate mannosyltransferase
MEATAPMNSKHRPSIATICPVYNEERAIPLFLDRILKVFSELSPCYDPRLYFIDNGCLDRSLSVIKQFHERHPNIFVIVLSRNFGYQCALETALRVAIADLYVMIDVDCEDPPEMILDFIQQYEKGFDIVYGERVDRPEGYILKALRKVYYRVARWVADDDLVLDMAEFSLITREVRDAIIKDATSFPFVRSSIGRIGFTRKNLPYRRQKRIIDKSHYNFVRMTIFGIAGILSSSTAALRAPAYTFGLFSVSMVALTAWAILAPAAWQIPTLILIGFLFLGFTTVATGLYVARVYKNGLQRPNAIIRFNRSVLPCGELDQYHS